MRVSEAMTRDVRVCSPGSSIRDCARMMTEIDAGAMPVGDNDCLIGMITDRDIAIRAVACGKGPDTPVGEIMSGEIRYCFEDEELDHVAKNMADLGMAVSIRYPSYAARSADLAAGPLRCSQLHTL